MFEDIRLAPEAPAPLDLRIAVRIAIYKSPIGHMTAMKVMVLWEVLIVESNRQQKVVILDPSRKHGNIYSISFSLFE